MFCFVFLSILAEYVGSSEEAVQNLFKSEKSVQIRTSLSFAHVDLSTVAQIGWPTSVPISNDGLRLAVFESQASNGPYALKLVSIRTVNRAVHSLVGPSYAGYLDGLASVAQFNGPTGLAFSPDDSWLAVADASNNAIRRVNASSGLVTTLAGFVEAGYEDGPGLTARFNYPTAVSFSPDARSLYVSDSNSNVIRRIDLYTSTVSSVAGKLVGTFPLYIGGFQDGQGSKAWFNYPQGIVVSPDGARVYVTDRNNHAIRQIDIASSAVSTIAGSGYPGNNDGASPQFNYPTGVAHHPTLEQLAVADTGSHRIRTIDLTSRTAATLAGSGISGFQDGPAATASMAEAWGVSYADGTHVYLSDRSNNRVRMISSIACGDGVWAGSEECDGGAAGVTGCTATCEVAAGYHCGSVCRDYCPVPAPSTCATRCGDGIVAGAEACDTGNLTDGGCTAACTVRAGYRCWTAAAGASVCAPLCGDEAAAEASPNCTLAGTDTLGAGGGGGAGWYYAEANVSIEPDAGSGWPPAGRRRPSCLRQSAREMVASFRALAVSQQ